MPPPFPISDHSDGHWFFNPGVHINRNWGEVLRWRMTSRGERWSKSIEIETHVLPPPKKTGS